MSRPKQNRLFDLSISTPREQIDNRLTEFTRDDLFIAIPATVVKVDEYESKQIVDVQPVFDLQWIDGRIVTASILKKIFVKIEGSGGFYIKFPIALGDLVTLHYSQKSISNWLDTEGSQLTQSVDYVARERDCWVVPGFGTRKVNQSPSQTNFIIQGPNTTITITPTGEVTLDTQGNIDITTEGDVSVISTGSSYLKSSAHTIDTDVQINGNLTVTQTTTSDTVDATNSLLVDSKEIKDHDHAINSGSSSPGPTGPNN